MTDASEPVRARLGSDFGGLGGEVSKLSGLLCFLSRPPHAAGGVGTLGRRGKGLGGGGPCRMSDRTREATTDAARARPVPCRDRGRGTAPPALHSFLTSACHPARVGTRAGGESAAAPFPPSTRVPRKSKESMNAARLFPVRRRVLWYGVGPAGSPFRKAGPTTAAVGHRRRSRPPGASARTSGRWYHMTSPFTPDLDTRRDP